MFASVIIAAGALIIVISRDLVRSVLFLFVLVFNAAGIFLLLDAILVAACLVTDICGRITVVLFFCAILVLDLSVNQVRSAFKRYSKIVYMVGAFVVFECFIFLTVCFAV